MRLGGHIKRVDDFNKSYSIHTAQGSLNFNMSRLHCALNEEGLLRI